ncbi:ribosomal-processing cysteine protease Prp [Ammoniphilus sp. CFH 90114]|uniref:ribosomal-processing cysteine protease Prp n=1 Tax=Ammoniphilus sp. CFH 90114 TaxID=2493665 RepID=UPI00100E4C80|nr:ribosomal-processing cysteine protease Prp [Ammoniphilus sp. CFH 90114]RXT14730.1 ribosomal-processing cysteine protease Prp [Ammoniphilus sp. CFH 90114]
MIKVHVKRRTSGDIELITIDGHAGYADPGQDIVCAAVSGISFGAINAVDMLLGVKLPVEQGENGFLRCTLPVQQPGVQEKVQLLLDGMVASLQSVAIEYGKFVKVYDQLPTRRWM